MGEHRWAVLLVALAVGVASVSAARSMTSEPTHAVAAIVQVTDPVDGWFGSVDGIEGDVELARLVLGPMTTVGTEGTALRFVAEAPSRSAAELALTDVLIAYESAREELRADLATRP